MSDVAARSPVARRPEVIVDFLFREGLLFVSVENIGEESAHRVRVRFSRRIFGVEGTREISAKALFKKLEFLPPHKRIETFVDTSHSYFSRKQPTRITVRVTYRDGQNRVYRSVIKHNLEIYRDIGFVNKQG